jgi:diguanylate cyclase (GGDEF)-like protein
MSLDTKTLWMALTVSNLLFGLLMLAYAYPGAERPVIRTWAVGQLLKGAGIAAILFRGQLPPGIAFAGNSLVIVGYFVELWAFLGYGGRQSLQRPALLLLATLLLVMNGAAAMTAHGWATKHTATVFSSCMAVLTACSALAMLRSNRPRSTVQMVLVAGNALVATAFLTRALLAAASPVWVPDGNMAINQALFAVGYVFSITDGFGFLLLVKEDADRSLLRMATEDGLTGLANRAAFMRRADECRRLCQRTGQPAAVVMMDVDHFKRINDTFGHAAGDVALAAIGRTLREHLRDVDICGRLGGEEFAMLLPGTSAEAAVHVAERLRHAIADTGFPFEGRVVGLTASFGIADPGTAGTLEQALSQADTSLYAAKSEGRNRVAAASDRTARRTASVVKLVT